MNLGEMLARNATCYPDKTALVFEDLRLNYRQLNEPVDRLSGGLIGLGIRKGGREGMPLTCLGGDADE